jgi:hypothetical protein
MMKLIVIRRSLISRLRNAEHFDIFENIVEHVGTLTLKPVELRPYWNAFLKLFEKEDQVYKRSQKYSETRLIQTANQQRQAAYLTVKGMIDIAAYSDSLAVREASQQLTDIVENYGAIYNKPMTEASSLIFNMIQDLRSAKYAPAVAQLNMTSAVDRLERENEAFKALYVERTTNQEGVRDEGGMSDIRPKVDDAFNTFADKVNIFYQVNEEVGKDADTRAVLSDIIRFVDSFLHRYEAIYSRRSAKVHFGKEPSSPDDPLPDDETGEIPRLAIGLQSVVGESATMSGFGAQMSLRASDPEAFTDALYPMARNGHLRMKDPTDGAYYNFPIAEFIIEDDDTQPAGFFVDPYSQSAFFEKPFMGLGVTEAEVIRDGETLAYLDDVSYPALMLSV